MGPTNARFGMWWLLTLAAIAMTLTVALVFPAGVVAGCVISDMYQSMKED